MRERIVSLALCFVMLCTGGVQAFAADQQSNAIVIDTSPEHMYYDTQLNANVIAFTCNKDGTVNYLTKGEAEAFTNITEDLEVKNFALNSAENINNTEIAPRDYYQYYKFKQISGPVKITGSLKKVSQDIEYSAGGSHVSKTVSTTSTHYFSASVNTAEQKSAVQAGATIGWEKSASASTTFTFDLLPGQKGYIGFYPYFNRVYGDLELYGNWGDGLISSTKVYGYSVKLTDEGEADGLFKFILY